MKKRLLLLSYLLFLLPAQAHAWWNNDWSFRKQLTLDTTAAGADIQGNLDDVPVLVRLHTGNFNYFLDLKQDASDLRFIAGDDKTPLKFHIEKFDPVNQMALIWVKVPKLMGTSSTNRIWMYYGNAKAANAEDAAGTYGVHQALVYHFEKTTGAPKDQTGYANHPSQYTAQTIPTGLIGGGAHFSGAQRIDIPDTASLAIKPDAGWTFSAWVKIDAPQKDAYIMLRQDGPRSLAVGIDGTTVYARYNDGTNTTQTPAGAALTTGAWHLVALTVGQGQLTLYIGGQQSAAVPAPMADMAGDTVIGAASDGGHGFQR